jgi:hypothetical protein
MDRRTGLRTLQLNPDIFPIGLHLLDRHFQMARNLPERED